MLKFFNGADPRRDPVPLDPWIQNRFLLDPGSPTDISESTWQLAICLSTYYRNLYTYEYVLHIIDQITIKTQNPKCRLY
jgi:hypothetical protein